MLMNGGNAEYSRVSVSACLCGDKWTQHIGLTSLRVEASCRSSFCKCEDWESLDFADAGASWPATYSVRCHGSLYLRCAVGNVTCARHFEMRLGGTREEHVCCLDMQLIKTYMR
jgi:hypothetical protein